MPIDNKLRYKESPWFKKDHYPPMAESHVGAFECTKCGMPATFTDYGTYYKHELFCGAKCMLDWHELQRHTESNIRRSK